MRLAHSKGVRIFSAVTAGAVAVTIGAMAAPGASGSTAKVVATGMSHGKVAANIGHHASGVLYSQTSDDSGVGIISQNFEASFNQYDAQGADDFTVPSGHTWKVTEVDTPGVYFNGPGPARSETVFFYHNRKGLPGKLVMKITRKGADSAGSFAIHLGKKGPNLGAGKYWVSVRPNMDFGVGGEWGWETTLDQAGNPGAWRNPGGGFAVGCTTWGVMQTCLGAQGEGPDFMFSLSGNDH